MQVKREREGDEEEKMKQRGPGKLGHHHHAGKKDPGWLLHVLLFWAIGFFFLSVILS